jgi:hypothetical protein
MTRALSISGILAVGTIVGWVLGRMTLSDQEAGRPLLDLLLSPLLQHDAGNTDVDLSGLSDEELAVAEKLTFRAAFVRGSDLEGLGKSLGGRPQKRGQLERQIYLIVCLEPRENTGKRLMSLTMEIVRPKRLAGTKIRIAGGLLQDDCVYHVEQVVDTDTCLPGDPRFRTPEGEYKFAGDEGPSLRDEIVRSQPEFRIVQMHVH